MVLTLSSSPAILSVEPVRIAELSANLSICAAGIQKGQYLPPRRLSRRSGGAVLFSVPRIDNRPRLCYDAHGGIPVYIANRLIRSSGGMGFLLLYCNGISVFCSRFVVTLFPSEMPFFDVVLMQI